MELVESESNAKVRTFLLAYVVVLLGQLLDVSSNFIRI